MSSSGQSLRRLITQLVALLVHSLLGKLFCKPSLSFQSVAIVASLRQFLCLMIPRRLGRSNLSWCRLLILAYSSYGTRGKSENRTRWGKLYSYNSGHLVLSCRLPFAFYTKGGAYCTWVLIRRLLGLPVIFLELLHLLCNE